MSDIFFTEKTGKYVLDIPPSGFTINDENNDSSDDFIVNWTYPLSIFETSVIRKIFPDLRNPTAKKRKKDSGFLNIYGDVFPCDIKFLGAQDHELKVNFEFGVGVIKILDKKLQEIDFGKIETSNLYNYIDATLGKSYPEAIVCFPRIFTDRDFVTEIGNLYGGRNFFNDSNDGLIYRNEVTPAGQVIFNIIKPIVYILYLLKKGFENEGYSLQGDILEDNLIKNLGFNHNNFADEKTEMGVKKLEVINEGWNSFGYDRSETFAIIGAFTLSAFIPNKVTNDQLGLRVRLYDKETGALLYDYSRLGRDRFPVFPPYSWVYPDFSEVTFELPTYTTFKEVVVRFNCNYLSMFNMGTGKLFTIYLNPKGNNGNYFLLNNTLQLNKYLPDTTFKNIVNCVKKLGNYKIEFHNKNEIHFNRISNVAPNDYVDLSFTEVTNPEIITNEKEKYVLSYGAPESEGFSDYIIDANGSFYGGLKADHPNAEEISFDCYPLQNREFLVGGATAQEPADGMNGLGFVQYTGLKNNVNNTDALGSWMIIDIYASRYNNLIQNRLNADGIKWKFYTTSSKAIRLKSTDIVYAYNSFNKVVSIIKKTNENGVFEIELQTENRF